jgi:hypothetical protein
MRRSWTPSIVQNGHDQTFYIVINNYGTLGPAFAETDLGETDLETTIDDLMSGQYSDPVRVVAFNTTEHGPRMHRRTSRGRLCAALISPGMKCRHRYRHSLKATSARSVSSP